jgi:hypothetical protein
MAEKVDRGERVLLAAACETGAEIGPIQTAESLTVRAHATVPHAPDVRTLTSTSALSESSRNVPLP